VTKTATDSDFVLYSDGGSSSGGNAAGATIVLDNRSGEHFCAAIGLGTATNNEAEILAALLGFAAVHALTAGKINGVKVRWVADSEYILKSATGYIFNWQRNGWKTADKKPVKNQGLWQTYLTYSAGLRIESEHVRGHTGHIENESCDEAVRFLKSEADALFTNRPTRRADISTHLGEHTWICLDGRSLLENLRTERPDEADQLALLALLRTELDNQDAGPKKLEKVRKDPFKLLLDSLDQALRYAEKAAGEHEGAKTLASKVRDLLQEVQNLRAGS